MTPSIPSSAGGQPLAKAVLVIEAPAGVEVPSIPLRFNPTDYQIQKSNQFQDIAIPGLEAPPLQFVRGGAETLAVQVLLDTSDTLEDVSLKYVYHLDGLTRVQSELHAPPIVRFVWQRTIFRGVLESLAVSYELFSEEGIPLRARVDLKLKAYRPSAEQVRAIKASSPDTEKSVVLRRGDRLDTLSERIFGDPARWRDIAKANGIRDPRDLQPGRQLLIPRIQNGRRA